MTTVNELISRADSLPPGPAKRQVLDEALAIARSNDDLDQEFAIRGRILQSAPIEDDSNNEDVLVQLSSLITLHQSDPARFPGDSWPGAVFWYYPWAVEITTRSTAFTREHIDQLLKNMRHDYSQAGQSLAAYEQSQLKYALDRGDSQAAQHHAPRLEAYGRSDPWVECDAHTAALKVGLELESGRAESAIALLEQLLDDGYTCIGEPETTIGLLLPAYISKASNATGSEKTEILHRIALLVRRGTEGNGTHVSVEGLGGYLLTLAVGGELERGKALLESGLRRVSRNPLADYDCVRFMIGSGVLLDAIVEAGFGDIHIADSHLSPLARFFGPSNEPKTAKQLAPLAWDTARQIGAVFDRRDQSNSWKRRLEDAEGLSRQRLPIPLPSKPLPVQSETGPRDMIVDTPHRWLTLLVVGFFLEATSTVDELLTQFSSMTPHLSPEDQLAAEEIRLSFAQELGDVTLEDVYDALYEVRRALGHHDSADIMRHFGADKLADPASHLDELYELLQNTDDTSDAAFMVAVLYAQALDRQPEPAPTNTMLEASVMVEKSARTVHGDLMARDLRMKALASVGEIDELTAEYHRCIEELDPDVLLRVHVRAAEFYELDGLDELALCAREDAITERLRLGLREGLVGDVLTNASTLQNLERHDEAIAQLEFAIREANAQGHPRDMIRDIELSRGSALTLAGRHQAAIDVFERELVSLLVEDPDHSSIPEALMSVGQSLTELGRAPEAIAAWRKTITLSLNQDLVPIAVRTVILLADHLEKDVLQFSDSLTQQQIVLSAARDYGNQDLLIESLNRIAITQSKMGDDSALTTLDEVSAIEAALDIDLVISPTRADVFHNLGRWEESAREKEALAEMAIQQESPTNASLILVWAATDLEDVGLISEATSILEKAQNLPNLPAETAAVIWDVAGEFWERQNKLNRAREAREKAARLNEDS